MWLERLGTAGVLGRERKSRGTGRVVRLGTAISRGCRLEGQRKTSPAPGQYSAWWLMLSSSSNPAVCRVPEAQSLSGDSLSALLVAEDEAQDGSSRERGIKHRQPLTSAIWNRRIGLSLGAALVSQKRLFASRCSWEFEQKQSTVMIACALGLSATLGVWEQRRERVSTRVTRVRARSQRGAQTQATL